MWTWLNRMAARIRALFRAGDDDRDFGLELESHLSMLTEDKIRSGMTAEEARREARLELGGLAQLQQAHREIRLFPFVDTLLQDARYGLTMLRRNPGFTFVAVLTLALGIGATTAIFSIVNAVLLRPLPYRDPDRLVLVFNAMGQDFLRWRDQSKAFESMAAFRFGTADYTGSGEPERLAVGVVSVDLFATLGVAPALGRAFTPEEDREGVAPVVVLSDSFWRRRFGSDPQVIGRALTIDSPVYPYTYQRRTVIGIMPPGFRFHGDSDLWMPLITQGLGRMVHLGEGDGKPIYGVPEINVSVIARLKPGLTLEAAEANLPVIRVRKPESQRQPHPGEQITRTGGGEGGSSRLGAPTQPISINIPPPRADGQVSVIGLRESLIGNVRLQLLILFGAVAFVLLIACANVANLLLSRSAVRQKEMAIRAALGAGRLRLVRQLLTESLLLAIVGGAAGLLAAKWGVKLLVAMSPAEIARINESGPSSLLDGRVLGFTCLVVLLTGLLAGVFPALQTSKIDINETLKAQSTAGSGRSRRGGGQRALPALMIAEFALALVLLVGAGLMIKSFLLLMAVPKGFNPDGVLTLTLSPSFTNYPEYSPRRIFYFQEALARVQALPGVQSAGLTGFLPLTKPSTTITGWRFVEGRPLLKTETAPSIVLNSISPDYFKTIGIQLLAGRGFAATDGKEAPRVAIINETFARHFLPNENPIGRRLWISSPRSTIVGVVGDTRHSGLDQRVSYEIYLPYLQDPDFGTGMSTLAVRVASDQNNPAGRASSSALASLTSAIRDQVRAIDPNESVYQVVRMDERLSNSVAERRFQTLLLSFFSGIALVIATVGIYGVISYAVSRRTHEIGVRMALGALAGDVLRMVLWRAMSLTLVGVGLGLGAALALTRVLKNLLFEVSTTDPTPFALIALLLICVALIASYIPARRATKVDPLQALRHE